MNTPRTDEKDQSLRGNFAMFYGVMVEFARWLQRQLDAAIAERDAARAAASEAWNECETARNQRDDAKRERDAARAEIEVIKPNAGGERRPAQKETP